MSSYISDGEEGPWGDHDCWTSATKYLTDELALDEEGYLIGTVEVEVHCTSQVTQRSISCMLTFTWTAPTGS
jgi:hypothetical protein